MLRFGSPRFLILWFSICHAAILSGQYQQQSLFPGDSSFQLLQKIVQAYKPLVVLDYTRAREKMYTEIYNHRDSVSCVYTKHQLYLDPSSPDPIGYLFKNGNANGINCEHTFPQSKGADNGNARSDMHHLFPARAAVNEARSNNPFAEIRDASTDTWFYRSFSQSNIPSAQIDEYSESTNNQFEPREDHKGNVARAIFYFFSMYELQADRNFFETMRPVLCDWHLKDPVDSLEWVRSFQIAAYQDQKTNPFVLDCSLPRRLYCSPSSSCMPVATDGTFSSPGYTVRPNPFSEYLELSTPEKRGELHYAFIQVDGGQVFESVIQASSSGYRIQTDELPSGFYLLKIIHQGQTLNRFPVVKI